MFYDNPFPDTSKSNDTNLQYYNLLRAYFKFIETDFNGRNSVTSKDELAVHLSALIFSGLIKSIEA
jgi:hypothetical protein